MAKIGVGYHKGILGSGPTAKPSPSQMPDLPSSFYQNSRGIKNNYSGMIGGIVSAGASLGSSLYNIFTQNSRNKAAAREQRLENERNRNFQREMAELSYQRNIEQWHRENAYNSPVEQRKRLQEAGLNADLFYGGGPGNMLSADSPQMSTPSGGGSPASGAVGRGIPEFDTLAVERARAEIANIKANTEKTESESSLNEAELRYVDELLQGKCESQRVSIALNQSQIRLNDDQRKLLAKQVDKLTVDMDAVNQSISESKQKVHNMKADEALKWLEYQFQSSSFQSRLDSIIAKSGLDRATASYMAQMALTCAVLRPEQLEQLQTNNKLLSWQTHIAKNTNTQIMIQNGRLAFDFSQARDFDTIQRIVNMVNESVRTGAQAFVAAKGGAWIDFRMDRGIFTP